MGRGDLKAKIRLEGDASGANRAIKQTEKGFSKFASNVKKNALAIGAALASLVGAFRLIKSSAEKAGQSTAFQSGLASQGIAADEFIAKLREVSDSQIANADLILATNRAIALGIRADDLPKLLQTAAQASVKLGVSMTQAFNDITTGVGRASPLILDNLGIVVDSVRVYKSYAEEIGKTVEQLTKMERTQALTNEVIRGGLDTTKKFTDAQSELQRSISKGTAALNNIKEATGTVLGGLVQMTVSGVLVATLGFSLFFEAATKLSRGLVGIIRLVPGLGGVFQSLAEDLKNVDDKTDAFQQRILLMATELGKSGQALFLVGTGLKEVEAKASLAAPAVDRIAEAVKAIADEAEDATEEIDGLSDGFNRNSVEAREAAAALSLQTEKIRALGVQAFLTSAALESLALAQARTALAVTQDERSRIGRVIGSDSGGGTQARGSYTGLPVGNVGTFIVQPDGTLRPA